MLTASSTPCPDEEHELIDLVGQSGDSLVINTGEGVGPNLYGGPGDDTIVNLHSSKKL